MTLWHNAAFDLPALGVVTFEEDDEKTEALISDSVLVYTADGRMLVAEYEEDEAFAFRGWVQTDPVGTIDGVTHWTDLPRPPKGATP